MHSFMRGKVNLWYKEQLECKKESKTSDGCSSLYSQILVWVLALSKYPVGILRVSFIIWDSNGFTGVTNSFAF